MDVRAQSRLLTEPPLRELLGRLVGAANFDVRSASPARGTSQWGVDYVVEVRDPDGTPYLLEIHCSRAPGATSGCGRVGVVVDGEERLFARTITSESLLDGRLVRKLVGARPQGRLARHYGDRLILEPGDLGRLRSELSDLLDSLEPYVPPQPDPPPLTTSPQATRRPRLSPLAASSVSPLAASLESPPADSASRELDR